MPCCTQRLKFYFIFCWFDKLNKIILFNCNANEFSNGFDNWFISILNIVLFAEKVNCICYLNSLLMLIFSEFNTEYSIFRFYSFHTIITLQKIIILFQCYCTFDCVAELGFLIFVFTYVDKRYVDLQPFIGSTILCSLSLSNELLDINIFFQ